MIGNVFPRRRGWTGLGVWGYLSGTVDEAVFAAKSGELKAEKAKTEQHLPQVGQFDPSRGAAALAIFDWSQEAANLWRGSNKSVRREILDTICLNRKVSDVSLCLEIRTPFRALAERRLLKNSRDDWI